MKKIYAISLYDILKMNKNNFLIYDKNNIYKN